jgi:hypothetical protein
MLGSIDYEFNTQQPTSTLDQDISKRMEAELELTELDARTTKHCGLAEATSSWFSRPPGGPRSFTAFHPPLAMSDVSVLNVHSPTRSVLMLSTFVA